MDHFAHSPEEVTAPLIEPLAPAVSAEAPPPLEDANAQRMLVDRLEIELMKYPPEAQQLVSQDLTAARNALANGQPVDGAVLSRLQQTMGDIEMKQALQAVGGAALGAGALAELAALNPFAAQLAQENLVLSASGIRLTGNNLSAADLCTPAINPGQQVAALAPVDKTPVQAAPGRSHSNN